MKSKAFFDVFICINVVGDTGWLPVFANNGVELKNRIDDAEKCRFGFA